MTTDRLHHPELQTLVQTTSFHAHHQPTTPAVVFEGRTVTYEQLHRVSNRIAHAIQAAGLAPGDRVAYLGKESEHYYEILFGCAKSGTVLVPVNWRLTAPEVSHILRDSGTRLLFLEAEFGPIVEKMPTAPPETVVELGEPFAVWKASHPDTDPTPHVTPDTPVAQLYTSGTTGLPKGVVLAHRSFFAIRDALASEGLDWIDWRAGDIALIGIPGFHIGGLWWAT
jgi:long-chain acyl-CoA synthetase